LNAQVPSVVQAPPLACWFTVTGTIPEGVCTRKTALVVGV